MNSLALPLQSLAVESIIQAASVGALLVAFAVVEVPPALQGGATVLPRVIEIQRAVATVPSALVIVTLGIANGISAPAFALSDFTLDLHLRRRCDVSALPSFEGVVKDVAEESVEVGWTGAAEERGIVDGLAGAAIVAGVVEAGRVHACLALVSAEAWWAETAGTQVSRHAGSAVTTAQGATGLGVIFTGGARVTLRESQRLASAFKGVSKLIHVFM